jgi:hypothetical protein
MLNAQVPEWQMYLTISQLNTKLNYYLQSHVQIWTPSMHTQTVWQSETILQDARKSDTIDRQFL